MTTYLPISLTELKCLETSLLQPELRQSPQDLATLLAEDFVEFGSSGQIFDKPQTIATLQTAAIAPVALMDFQARALATDVVLVTYRAIRLHLVTQQNIHSLHSSVWKLLDERWQIVFHQGTPSAPK